MTITFDSGEGSLEVEPDSLATEHAAFLADLVMPGATRPGQLPPANVEAASDVSHETIERLVSHIRGLAIIDAA